MQYWLFHPRHSQLAVLITGASVAVSGSVPLQRQDLPPLQASSGLQLLIDQENAAPTLRVILPGRSAWEHNAPTIVPLAAGPRGQSAGVAPRRDIVRI